MDVVVDQLTIPDLDKPHFLLYLNFTMFEDELPEGYLMGIGYKKLYNKIMKVLFANAVSVDPTAFRTIQLTNS
jgi:hypothetical protein